MLTDLHRIPILIEGSHRDDSRPRVGQVIRSITIGYADLTPTSIAATAGSYTFLKSFPKQDPTVIAKLRATGPLALGKTTMTEFGNLNSSSSNMG